jgi:DNA-3-methyladenine glycosylase I
VPKPSDWQHHKIDKPKNDDEYFERMARVIFAAGLSWATLEKKWEGLKEAFYNLKISNVARMNEVNIARLMANQAMIRNRPKIEATVNNAREFQAIADEHGSFENYLKALRDQGGEDALREEINKRFAFMGKGTTVIFLHAVGEDLPKAQAEWEQSHR